MHAPAPAPTGETLRADVRSYIKAYLTASGALYGEYDLDISPGGTYEMLEDCLGNWRRNVVTFNQYFN